MKRKLLVLFCAASTLCSVAVAGPWTDDQLSSVTEVVAGEFLEPESARFRSVQLVSGEPSSYPNVGFYCGEVNARDADGVYSGFVPFYVAVIEGKASVIGLGVDETTETVIRDNCRRLKADSLPPMELEPEH